MYRSDKCRRCDAPCSSSPTKCVECDLACYCSPKCKADDQWRHEVDCDIAKFFWKCCVCNVVNKESTKQCPRCLEVSYCSKSCQKKDWPRHKPICAQIADETIQVARRLNTHWSGKPSISCGAIYYWGNMPAVDLINLSLNEGSDYARPLSLLLCGVGDLRNVALSAASLPEGYQERLTFVLNDISICTLARTVLLLYMLLEGGAEVAQTVTQVWYSVRITEESHGILMSSLQRLIQAQSLEELTNGVINANITHFKTLKRVWQTWLDLTFRNGPWVTAERSKTFARDVDAMTGIPHYLAEIPTEHVTSAKEWFDSGILLSEKSRESAKRENITLTGSTDLAASGHDVSFEYCIPTDCSPFTSWDYRDVKAFHSCPSLLEAYSKYVNHVLAQCASKLASGQVKFHCVLGNCLKIQRFLPDGISFDRILTTNLLDYIPLPTLLGLCKPLLNPDNACAVIVTESLNWSLYLPQMKIRLSWEASAGVNMEKVLNDTGNSRIACSTCMIGITEYYDFDPEFQRFLRASLLSPDYISGKQIPPLQALALKYGVVLRNYCQNENRVFPHRWPINCRRVTQLDGFERAVEWLLPARQ